MERRPERSRGASACRCRTAAAIFACACCLLVLMAAATDGVSLGRSAAAPAAGGGVDFMASSPAGGVGAAGADAFRSSKRRIPRGPDPIHNRRAGKTTVAPRRSD